MPPFKVVSVVNSKLPALTGGSTQNLAVLLRSGALIAPIQIVEERTIGPSLGAQNVEQGLQASFWGLMVVVVFMIIYYRKFGIIADIALIANIVLLVGLVPYWALRYYAGDCWYRAGGWDVRGCERVDF